MLPPDCRRVWTTGDPGLGVILEAAGLELVDDPSRAEAVLADLPSGTAGDDLLEAVRALPAGGVVGVAVAGGSPAVVPDPPRLRRAAQLLASPAAAVAARRQAARVAAWLAPAAGPLEHIATGDRSRLAGIGTRALTRLRRPPLGWLLVSRPPDRLSVVDTALRDAGEALGGRLELSWLATQPSSKVLVHLDGDGADGHLLRVAAQPARPWLDQAIAALGALAADRPPDLIAGRLAPFDAAGESGVARWGLERMRPGAHPRTLDAGLWRESFEFLIALRGVRPAEEPGPERLRERLETHAGLLARYAGPEAAARLQALPAQLEPQLAGLPLGWVHGDFWSGNMMVRDGRLDGVIDWEWAGPDGLPVHDLFDLIVLGPLETRYLPPGGRLHRILLPLARGGDERVREYCRALDLPCEPAVLEALAIAYWLDRTARWLAPYDSRRHIPGWLAANVDAPTLQLP